MMRPIARSYRLAALLALACLAAPALAAPPTKIEWPKRPAADSLAKPAAISPDSAERRVQRALGQPVTTSSGDAQGPAVDTDIPGYWRTRAERSGWRTTEDYDETLRYCRQLEAGSRWVHLTSYGRSEQGRDLPLLIVSKDRAFTPAAARALGKPIVLIQNGIHAGEIEGKDACLELVRDLAVLRRHDELLDSCTVLILPIFSVDAHERHSRYNRINQNGPDEMGWRATPIGLNLNRDYMKVETPEMRALLTQVYTQWWPELLIDDHTTDGADYRHDVTYAYSHGAGTPPSLDRWFRDAFEARVVPRLTALGHLPAPYLSFRKGSDPTSGIDFANMPPRFSTAYPPLHGRASLLVETHMLKPYGERVKATYDLLYATLEELHAHAHLLMQAVRQAGDEAIARGRASSPAARQLVLATRTTEHAGTFAFKGKVAEWTLSPITGTRLPHYTSAPWDTLIPLYADIAPTLTVTQPVGYLIPQEWTDAIDHLDVHAIRYRRLAKSYRDSVEMVHVLDYTSDPENVEGHHMLQVSKVRLERQLRSFRAGDVWVPLDQPSGALAVALLEAQAPDGLMAWNAFDTVFLKKEYGEDYVVAPLAEQMLAKDAKLAAEFQAKLAADSAFAKNPGARSDFFYRRSPWADPDQDLDPIARALRPVPEELLVPPGGTLAPGPPGAPKR